MLPPDTDRVPAPAASSTGSVDAGTSQPVIRHAIFHEEVRPMPDNPQLAERNWWKSIITRVDLDTILAWGKRLLRRPFTVIELLKAIQDCPGDIDIETPTFSASKKIRPNKPPKITIREKPP